MSRELKVKLRGKNSEHRVWSFLYSLGSYLCQWLSVDTDESLSALAVGHCGGGFLATEGLHRLDGFFAIGHL